MLPPAQTLSPPQALSPAQAPRGANPEALAANTLRQMGVAVASLANAGGADPLPAALRAAAAAGGPAGASAHQSPQQVPIACR